MSETMADGFERMHAAVSPSLVYRDAVRHAMSDLPDWLVPYSIVALHNLERIAEELALTEGDALLD